MIEREIIIGLITNTEFCQAVRPLWNPKFLESNSARKIAGWCIEYFDEFREAPVKNIESIYFEKLRQGEIPKEIAEEIEEDILPGLSIEFAEGVSEEGYNLEYAIKNATKYFDERSLVIHNQEVKELLDSGDIDEAKKLIDSYRQLSVEFSQYLDLSDLESLLRVKQALTEVNKPVFHFPGALGDFINSQLVRGGFVAFMASEKRGKSFWLLECALTAVRQNEPVAFFQAGDMTEAQQLKRICSYLTKRPDQERYVGNNYEPVKDCVHNQLDTCSKNERESTVGAFSGEWTEEDLRNKLTKEDILEAMSLYPEYAPCHNCKAYRENHWGSVWLKPIVIPEVLNVRQAVSAVKKFFVKSNRHFRLSSHVNGSLSVNKIKAILVKWEKEDGFIPSLIIIDYADILVPDVKTEFRHQQNAIWKDLRGLSQHRPWLLITVTQSDADSYEQITLKLRNFSEDKRKYGHATAVYGLNQDPNGREKKLGVLRINELVIREGESNPTNQVYVLQQLNIGKPFLTSFR